MIDSFIYFLNIKILALIQIESERSHRERFINSFFFVLVRWGVEIIFWKLSSSFIKKKRKDIYLTLEYWQIFFLVNKPFNLLILDCVRNEVFIWFDLDYWRGVGRAGRCGGIGGVWQ